MDAPTSHTIGEMATAALNVTVNPGNVDGTSSFADTEDLTQSVTGDIDATTRSLSDSPTVSSVTTQDSIVSISTSDNRPTDSHVTTQEGILATLISESPRQATSHDAAEVSILSILTSASPRQTVSSSDSQHALLSNLTSESPSRLNSSVTPQDGILPILTTESLSRTDNSVITEDGILPTLTPESPSRTGSSVTTDESILPALTSESSRRTTSPATTQESILPEVTSEHSGQTVSASPVTTQDSILPEFTSDSPRQTASSSPVTTQDGILLTSESSRRTASDTTTQHPILPITSDSDVINIATTVPDNSISTIQISATSQYVPVTSNNGSLGYDMTSSPVSMTTEEVTSSPLSEGASTVLFLGVGVGVGALLVVVLLVCVLVCKKRISDKRRAQKYQRDEENVQHYQYDIPHRGSSVTEDTRLTKNGTMKKPPTETQYDNPTYDEMIRARPSQRNYFEQGIRAEEQEEREHVYDEPVIMRPSKNSIPMTSLDPKDRPMSMGPIYLQDDMASTQKTYDTIYTTHNTFKRK